MFAAIVLSPPVQALCYPCIDRRCVGAYRIRPPWRGCCMFDGGILFAVIISFSPTSGRMRYAPTLVRLLSWPNTINHYTCSIEFWADNVMTKPSKRLRRCCLGSHKTLETVATMLTRVTQNRRNGCDDADTGHTKPSKRLRRC